MLARKTAARWLLPSAIWLTALLALSGCANSHAPEGWLPNAVSLGRDPYGAWITVKTVAKDGPETGGELIAVAPDTLHLLGIDGLVSLPRTNVHKARIAFFDPEMDRAGGWTALGTLSTLSHGIVLIISAPVWLIFGGTLTNAQARSALVDYPDATAWQGIGRYARFPQGLPPAVNRAKLRPKPYVAIDGD